MKILHVISSMNPKTGGVCQAVKTIVTSTNKLNVLNEVVSLDNPDEEFIKNNSFILHALGPAKGPWAQSDKLKPWLIKNIASFDSVIIHGLWLYPSYATEMCFHQLKKQRKNTKTKLFVMPHGMLDPYFQKASGRKLKALRNRIYWQIIESKVINRADGLLFTCEEEKILARTPFSPYHPKNELVVGLGVEKPPIFNPGMQKAFLEKCPNIENNQYLLFLGRIHEKKGVDLLVKAYIEKMGEWTKAGRNDFPKLVIAGPDLETAFGQQIVTIIESVEGANKHILFVGMLVGDAKWGAFYGCSGFILASHQENFGIAVVEALACGKPVFISDQINIWREIKESNAGIIAEDTILGTKELLFNWNKLIDNNGIDLMGKNAIACYEKYFAVDQSANTLLNSLQ